jgi:hypothetical protein
MSSNLEELYKMVSDNKTFTDAQIEDFLIEHEKGFDINQSVAVSHWDTTPLNKAVDSKRGLSTFKLLEKYGADYSVLDQRKQHVAEFMVDASDIQLLDYLRTHPTKPMDLVSFRNDWRNSLLIEAVKKTNEKLVRWLIEVAKLDVEARGFYDCTVLMIASENCQTEAGFKIFKMLIEEYGAKPVTDDAKGGHWTGLYLCRFDSFEAFKWYESKVGTDVILRVKEGKTLLHDAIRDTDNMILAKYLVRRFREFYPDKDLKKDYVDVKTEGNGHTALREAVHLCNLVGVKYLVEECGADYSDNYNRDKESRTLVHSVCNPCRSNIPEMFEVLKYLVEKLGCDCLEEAKDCNGRTAAHLLVQRNEMKIHSHFMNALKFLAARGFDFDVRDNEGKTVYQFAEREGNTDATKFLLEWSEDPTPYIPKNIICRAVLQRRSTAQNMKQQFNDFQSSLRSQKEAVARRTQSLENDIAALEIARKEAEADARIRLEREKKEKALAEQQKQQQLQKEKAQAIKAEVQQDPFTPTQKAALKDVNERQQAAQRGVVLARFLVLVVGCWIAKEFFETFL